MKDFESIYDKLCINFKQRVDMVTDEYKSINKEAFKKVSTVFIVAAIILVVVGYYINSYMVLIILGFLLGPLAIAFLIIRGKKMSGSNAFGDELPLEIYRAVLKELPYELTYTNLEKMDQEEYDSYEFESYSNYMSYSKFTGIFNGKNPFKMCYVGASTGHGDDISYPFRGYVLVTDLNDDKQINVMIQSKKHTYADENMKNEKIEYVIENIKELLTDYNKNTSLSCDCKIKNNKLIVRTYGNYYEMLRFDNLLNKKSLKNYYENLYNLFELTNKILNNLEK